MGGREWKPWGGSPLLRKVSPPFPNLHPLLFLKPQDQLVAAILGLVHNDRSTLDQSAKEHFSGQRIFQRFAEKTLQGTRAELGVIAFLGQPAPGFGRQGQVDLLVGKALAHFGNALVHNHAHQIGRQGIERHQRIQG